MQNYREGDKICIFGMYKFTTSNSNLNHQLIRDFTQGFSRGAYTARALGGMLYKVIPTAVCYIKTALTFPRLDFYPKTTPNNFLSPIRCSNAQTKRGFSLLLGLNKHLRKMCTSSLWAFGTPLSVSASLWVERCLLRTRTRPSRLSGTPFLSTK